MYYQQKAELPDLKPECLEYPEITAQVSQDVMLRVELAFQVVFRPVQAGKTRGYRRFQGAGRYHRVTYPRHGEHGGAVLDGGVLSLAKIGQVRTRLHRPLEGTPKTVTSSREADGWYACVSCAGVPANPLPPTGQETGIDVVGLTVFLIPEAGINTANPRRYRKAERQLARAQRRVSRARRAAIVASRRSRCSNATKSESLGGGATSPIRPR